VYVTQLWHHPVTGEPVGLARASAARAGLRWGEAKLSTRRLFDDRREQRHRVDWPELPPPPAPRVAVVAVNFNTARLIAQLIVSLYRVLDVDERPPILIVDNASQDESRAMLRGLRDAGLIGLLERDAHPYHASGLNAGLNWLAEHQDDPQWRVSHVAILDSDVVATRPGGLGLAVDYAVEAGAAIVGPARQTLSPELELYIHPSVTVLDPAQAWRGRVSVFRENGEPALAMQVDLTKQGRPVLPLPLFDLGFFIHVGRGTVRVIARSGDTDHRHFRVGHDEEHFESVAAARTVYAALRRRFAFEVPRLDAQSVAAACAVPERWHFDWPVV
jgi:hypothetical protein